MKAKTTKPIRRAKRVSPKREARIKVFQTFSRLVVGAIKIWLGGSRYILLADQAEDFIKDFPNVLIEEQE